MKLQPDTYDVQTIHGYGAGWINLDGQRIEHSLVVSSRGQRFDWDCSDYDALSPAHFSQLVEFAPELVLFGSGLRLRFPRPQWLEALARRRIGVETMDTAAACRTYNILAGEGRHVIAALLLEPPASPHQPSSDFKVK